MDETAEVENAMNQAAAETVARLDEMRRLAKETTAVAARGGFPPELLWEIMRIGNSVQFAEARASEYASKVAA